MPSWKKVVTSGSNAVLAEITASVGFKGDGSGLTNLPAQAGTITALNNQAANRLVTIGSTTTELDGEANLVFDGTNLGIGTTSPSSYFNSPLVTYQATSNYLTIATNTNGISSILMADGTSGDQQYRGQLEYKHTGDEWKFHAGNSVLATLNSSVGLSITGHITASGNIVANGNIVGDDSTDIIGVRNSNFEGYVSGSALVGKQTIASQTGANNVDLSTTANHNITITGNITLTPTNFSGRRGQSGIITLIQDSSGGHSITLNSLFKTPRGDSISFDTSANGISLMSYYVIDASNVAVNYLGPFS